MQSLTTASGSRLFDSVVRAMGFSPGRPGSNPTTGGIFFSIYASFLCCDFHVVRGHQRHGNLFRDDAIINYLYSIWFQTR